MSGSEIDISRALALVDAADTARAAAARPAAPTFFEADCHGIIGEYVRLWAPHTEAAPVAIYASALAACGALIGRGPTWEFGNTTHHARLFVLLIGESSAGRKGTALALGVRKLLSAVDEDFDRARHASGLSSAEGLIAEIRDATADRQVNGKTVMGDAGVDDKRLCVVEGEMGGPLEAMTREGNRLSAVVRDLWDGVDVRTMTKHDPQRASDPHVCIIGAITPAELKKLLSKTAVANGLANRLLPVWTTRARSLPEDSSPDPIALAAITRAISQAVETARAIHFMDWTPAAKEQWRIEYDELAFVGDASETLRALLQRGAPYVRRIAMLLALLDGTGKVDTSHLSAAIALWHYAADTWRFVYHDTSIRTPLAEKLLAALLDAGRSGLTRSQIRNDVVRSGDVSADTITAALRELESASLAVQTKGDSKGGRRAERWQHGRFVGVVVPDTNEGNEANERNGQESEVPSFTSFPPAPLSTVGADIGPGLDPYEWPTLTEEAA